MRIIRRDNRDAIFERLEGWWNNTIVDLLTGKRKEAFLVMRFPTNLQHFLKSTNRMNLPITFRGKIPVGEIDAMNDPRLLLATR
jgi:hypothetical protein